MAAMVLPMAVMVLLIAMMVLPMAVMVLPIAPGDERAQNRRHRRHRELCTGQHTARCIEV